MSETDPLLNVSADLLTDRRVQKTARFQLNDQPKERAESFKNEPASLMIF